MPLPKGKRFHYTYRLEALNPVGSERLYIGVRSCNVHPHEDGCYMSSSKHVAKAIAFGVAFQKTVLAIWPTRQEAVAHEVRLHELFSVAGNPEFFNRVRQTTTAWDTTGVKLTAEQKNHKSTQTHAAWSEQDKRERILAGQKAAYADPAVRANRRRSAVEHWKNPITREKNIASLKAALATPEARAIKKARTREQWERNRDERIKRLSATKEFCAQYGITRPGKGYCVARNHPAFAAFIEGRNAQ
jgi:hypothetical protein